MKGRMYRSTGGTNDAEDDLDDKPEARTNAKRIDDEAEERKHGGRTKRKRGGKAMGHIEGKAEHHAGRKPRKSGGGAFADSNPYTSAHRGKDPSGRSLEHGEGED